MQDIETAVRLQINVVALIWLDGEYGLIKWKQQNQFGDRHSNLAFGNRDFVMLARSFGAWGRTLGSPGDFPTASAEAFQQPESRLIATPVDYAENRKLTEHFGNLQFTF